MSTLDASKSLIDAADVESTLNDLKRRLAESEATNDNLKSYIDNLKKSYQTVFGAGASCRRVGGSRPGLVLTVRTVARSKMEDLSSRISCRRLLRRRLSQASFIRASSS